MLKKIGTIFLLFFSFSCFSQEITREAILSGGSQFEGGFGNISYTFGQSVVQTIESGNLIMTQGFQQPDDPAPEISSINLLDESQYQIYPIPNTGHFFFEVQSADVSEVKFYLIDITGSIVMSQNENLQRDQKIEFENNALPAGSYFLQMLNNESTLLLNHKIVINQ